MAASDVARVLNEAIDGRSAVIVLYAHDGELSARAFWPGKVRKAQDGTLSIIGFDSLRGELRSLRIDRIVQASALTFPPGRGPPG
jgi:predicted DNA-binding transcriptional regulator YafY